MRHIKERTMRFIGITGGVGAGKSAVLSYLSKMPNTRVMLADEIAHDLMEPNTKLFQKIKETFSEEDIYEKDGSFDRRKLATVIFGDEKKREIINGLVHPAVKEYVIEEYEKERIKGTLDYLFLEAALLIEEHYDEICDELWYIYTSEENRRKRLKAQRGYSDEKITQIINSQMSEEEFKAHVDVVIDNNHDIEETYAQIEEAKKRR